MAIRTVQISDIGPRENNIQIKVCVCRLWQAKKYKPVEKNDGLQFILVDEMVRHLTPYFIAHKSQLVN